MEYLLIESALTSSKYFTFKHNFMPYTYMYMQLMIITTTSHQHSQKLNNFSIVIKAISSLIWAFIPQSIHHACDWTVLSDMSCLYNSKHHQSLVYNVINTDFMYFMYWTPGPGCSKGAIYQINFYPMVRAVHFL